MNKTEQIREIVFESLKKLGAEEEIGDFANPSMDTRIRKHLDSMGVVALAVDLEELYEDLFDSSVKILNVEEANFMSNFETAETLVKYIDGL